LINRDVILPPPKEFRYYDDYASKFYNSFLEGQREEEGYMSKADKGAAPKERLNP